MMELTINGQVYQFNFGMGFLREINKQTNVPIDGAPGVKKDVGFRYALMNLMDGDPEALVNILDVANKGQNPRATRDLLDGYIDDENRDIDELTDTVMGFLKSPNATKRTTKELLDAVEKEKQRVEEEEARKRELMA